MFFKPGLALLGEISIARDVIFLDRLLYVFQLKPCLVGFVEWNTDRFHGLKLDGQLENHLW